MPRQKLALEKGGPKLLTIKWKGAFKELTVHFEDQLIGTVPNKQLLKQGQDFALPDDSELHVQLKSSFFMPELSVLRDGVPLPGSSSDPATQLKHVSYIIFFIAILNLGLGLLSILTKPDFLAKAGVGPYSVTFGAVFLVLGILVLKRSSIALILAIAIFALDMLAGAYFTFQAGGQPAILGIVFRIFLIMAMARGLGAVKQLK